jgi:acyl carrier protein phosphodiesterase
MNFLAHLFLSPEEGELLAGNFIADFISNRDLHDLSEGVRQGVMLHRHIDTFTDSHSQVRSVLRVLRPAHGKYAGVVWDVFGDALLTRHWAQFHPLSLRSFTKLMYERLHRMRDFMPEPMFSRLPRMIEDDWLMKVGQEAGIAYSLERISKRASKPEWLSGGVETYRKYLPELESAFLAFFPELIAETVILRNAMKK